MKRLLLRPFARPEDVHCALYHLCCLLAYTTAFWLWCHPDTAGLHGPLERVLFVAAAAYLLGWISGVDIGVNFHNHTHRRIFRSARLNRWFGRAWTFSGGWPAYLWQYAHVTVHHANLLEERDWTLPRLCADGRFESIYRYVLLHWPWRYAVHLFCDYRDGRMDRRQARADVFWFAVLWSVPFFIDPWMALWLWVLPQWLGNCITMGSGMYVQHAGCTARTAQAPVAHSNSYLSPFFNLTMFNIGYHVEHHDHPGVHWADLPAFHEQHRDALVDQGAHYLPYGYYGAAMRLARIGRGDRSLREFCAEQAPGYEQVAEHQKSACQKSA